MERTNVDAAYRKLGVGDAQGRLRPGRHDRDARQAAAGVLAGHALELLGRHRRRRPSDRGHLRAAAGRATWPSTSSTRWGCATPASSIRDDQVPRFAANYERQADGTLKLQSTTPRRARTRQASFSPAAAGWSPRRPTTMRFTSMLLNGGELDGVRMLGRKTVELMTRTTARRAGRGPARAAGGAFTEHPLRGRWDSGSASRSCSRRHAPGPGQPGAYAWGGAAGTAFWIDPVGSSTCIFMTQLMLGIVVLRWAAIASQRWARH